MLKKILSLLPIRLTYDKYVPMFYVNPYKFITGIKFIQKIRVKYWTNIAKQYGPFRPFYFREDPIIKDSNSKKKEIKNIYENGYAICENFFNEEDLSNFKRYIENTPLNFSETTGYSVSTLTKNLEEILQEGLNPFYEHFFPSIDLDKYSPSFIMRVDYSEDGVDPSPVTANWHIDRFIPTLNAIYFPLGSQWGSFEKDVGDPFIDEEYLKFISSFKQSSTNDFKKRDLAYRDLGLSKKVFDVPENTLLIGTHHIMHRRSPYSEPGRRVAIFVDHYNVLTRKHLLSYAK